MKVEQLYTKCLSQGAYYIESQGEVAIIDPLREVQSYIDKADEDNARIKYVFETHFHADFVSGHVTLSERTGAPIIYGPNADPTFEALIATDGQVFNLGAVTITVLHTPGHTMESSTYLLRDESGKDHAIFSGDTLFLGDVGRPDLAQKKGSMTAEDLAGYLFDSLRTKIMPLADEVIVYPAHGAGSSCGKNMMEQTVDTLGNQRIVNYALRVDMTKEEFVSELLDGLDAPPAYFPLNVKMNKEGYRPLDQIIADSNKAFPAKDFKALVDHEEILILDVRHQDDFCSAHIPNSLFIGLNGGFAPWVGELIKNVDQKIALLVDDSQIEEAITRLSRVGFDHVVGYLSGGVAAWTDAGFVVDKVDSISAKALEKIIDNKGAEYVVDVRKATENETSHIPDAVNYPLSKLHTFLDEISNEKSYIHCAGGYRSVIAASILKANGHHHIVNILGGMKDIRNTKINLALSACQV